MNATSTIERPVSLSGAPYVPGDPITVEHEDVWREGTVAAIARLDTPQRFGLHWLIRVDFDDAACEHTCTGVVTDDDGRNYTYRRQVGPSSRVAA